MRLALLLPIALLAAACTTDDAGTPSGDDGSDVVPLETGAYAGTYSVPTTDAALQAAATFAVDRVRWDFEDGQVDLHYDLPIGLVGGQVSVHLDGDAAVGALTIALSGTVGTGSCTAAGTLVTCREDLTSLGAMPISIEIVAQHATDYAGPVSDRISIANIFGSDPIGVITFDTATPIDD